MNLIQIYNFHHHEQRNNVHKCKHRKIAPNGPSPPPTARTYRLMRKSLNGAKNEFFIFHIPKANNSYSADEPRGKSRRMGCHQSHPALPYFGHLTRGPHTSCRRLPVAMPWRQHTSSTQHHDNKQPTPFRFRSSFGRVSVFHRYPEYPTATPGDSRSPGVAGVDHGVFPYRNWLAPARIWFWFGWFRKKSYLCTVKKNRISTTATT